MNLSGETRQILATLGVNLLSVSLGASMGWSSSAMRFLGDPKTADLVTGVIADGEAGLINSMYSVGGLFGSLIYGWVCDRIGRRKALITIAIPQLIAYVLIGLARNSMHILASRIFAGFSGGALYIAIPLFVSEISEDRIRGALGSMFILMCGTGLLLAYILGAFFHYSTVAWIYLLLPICSVIAIHYIPPSPFYLMKQENIEAAENSLKYFRGVTVLTADVLREFESLKSYVCSDQEKVKVKFSDFLAKDARKSIIIGVVLVGIEQFTGCFTFLFNVANIFEASGATGISSNVSTIIVGTLQLIGAYCSTFLVEKAGRKLLISVSAVGVAIGFITFGITTQLIEHGYQSTFIKLIPVFAMSFALFIANVGVFTLTFVVLSEICPSHIRSYIFTMCMCCSWIFTFVLFNMIDLLASLIGTAGVQYFFAFNAILGTIFVIFYIPETKGKSFEEISRIMQN